MEALRLQILQGIRLPSQLRRLYINLELFGEGHAQTFRDALPSVPRWELLETLKMTGIDHCRELAAALIHSCPPRRLMAIDMGGIFSFTLVQVAQQHCKNLERLRVEHPFPAVNADRFPSVQYIHEARESLRHIKWLTVSEKNPGGIASLDAFVSTHYYHKKPATVAYQRAQEYCLGDMMEALQHMPNLRRFAVTLDVYRFQPREIRDRLGLDSDDDEALTDDEILSWYVIQIRHISEAVPRLRELCLFSRHRIYRGTIANDGKTMRVLPDAVQPGVECSRFPWGLDP